MLPLIGAILLGIFVWFATGVDDLILVAISLKKTSGKSKGFLMLGNFVGAIIGLILAMVVAWLFGDYELSGFSLKIPAIIVIVIALKELWDAFMERIPFHVNRHVERGGLSRGYLHNFLIGFLIYILVSGINDFVVASVVMWDRARTLTEILGFGMGFLFGALVSILIAKFISSKIKNARTLDIIAGVVLLILGGCLLFNVNIF